MHLPYVAACFSQCEGEVSWQVKQQFLLLCTCVECIHMLGYTLHSISNPINTYMKVS